MSPRALLDRWLVVGSTTMLAVATSLVATACHKNAAYEDPQHPGYVLVPLVAVSRNEPPPYCQFRGSVVSKEDTDAAYVDLQRKAAAIGATHVVLDGTRASGITWGYRVKNELFGRAYWCPPPPASPGGPEAAAAIATPAAATSASAGPVVCNPACATGYACVNGACAAACSPACAANQVCAPDRVCRAR